MKLGHLGRKVVSVVNADDPVDLAIQHMWRLGIRHLPVVRGNEPVGMVSERDILFHVCWLSHSESSLVGEGGRPASGASRISTIMSSPAVSLSQEDSIEHAARLMLNTHISCLPLTEHRTIVGIVTESDVLKCYIDQDVLEPRRSTREAGIQDHFSANVFTLSPEDTTIDAVRLMKDKHLHHIPILSGDRLMGIVSERDVLRGTSREDGDHALSAVELQNGHEVELRKIMSSDLQVLGLQATMAEAAEKMIVHKVHALPVVEQSRLVGIITATDLLRALVAD